MKTLKDRIFAIIIGIMALALIYFAISDFIANPEQDIESYQEDF